MERLSILVIPAYKLFPADSGGAYLQLSFLSGLQNIHDIDILLTPENVDSSDLETFCTKFPGLNIIFVSPPGRGILSKLKAFFRKEKRKRSGLDVSYSLKKIQYVNLLVFSSPELLHLIRKVTSGKKYDIVQIEHTKNLSLVDAVAGPAKKIFVHHEIYFTRVLQDMTSLKYERSYAEYIADTCKAIEVYWLKKYDGIISLNESDRKLLYSLGITNPQQVAMPFALLKEDLNIIYNPLSEPGIVFMGGETHYPNKEGLTWFIENVWPIVLKECPQTIFRVTGHWSEDFIQQVKPPNVQFLGFVKDLEEVLQSSISVVPVHIGSGIKIKTITSLAKGLPVVATVHGADAVPGLVNGENIFVTDDPSTFAMHIIDLINDQSLRSKVSKNANLLARSFNENNNVAYHRNEFYNYLLANNKGQV